MNFVKMQATGNDFVIVEGGRWGRLAPRICDRRYGVGADGIIVLHPSKKADIRARFINPDGSEAEACGNGLRCVAKYVYERGIKKKPILIETKSGIKRAFPYVRGGKVRMVRVNMGKGEVIGDVEIDVGMKLKLTKVSVGNPHAVLLHDPDNFPLHKIGPKVENHPIFPERTNFEVAKVEGDGIKMRVWERGAGETLSCGTGACAVALAFFEKGLIGKEAKITLPGGELKILIEDEIWLEGPCEEVFRGEISWKNI